MSSFHNYNINFSQRGGICFVDFSFLIEDSEIKEAVGTIEYNNVLGIPDGIQIVTLLQKNILLYGKNTDNGINIDGTPHFSTNGTGFFSNVDLYLFSNVEGVDTVEFSTDSQPLVDQRLTLGCLLDGTKILTPSGYKLISEIKAGDLIRSEFKNIKVKKNLKSNIKLSEFEMPYKVPKGKLGANEDLYLTKGHAIKFKDEFKAPAQLGFIQQKIKDMPELKELIYYHLELECDKTENRRTNTIIANGVIVESYSMEPM